jgi:hypothetical protein
MALMPFVCTGPLIDLTQITRLQPVKIANIAQNTPGIDALDSLIEQAEADRSSDAPTDEQLADLTLAYEDEITAFRAAADPTCVTFYQAVDLLDAAQQARYRHDA